MTEEGAVQRDGAPGPQGQGGGAPAGQGQGSPGVQDRRRIARIRWGYVVLALAAAAVGVLIYQNTGPAPLRVFWWKFEIRQVVIILAAAVITLLIEQLVRKIIKWRKRRPRTRERPPNP